MASGMVARAQRREVRLRRRRRGSRSGRPASGAGLGGCGPGLRSRQACCATTASTPVVTASSIAKRGVGRRSVGNVIRSARARLVPRVNSFPSPQPRPTSPPAAAPRSPIRWWLVGPIGAAVLAVLVRWLSSGGLRHVAADRRGHRDPHAALESLKQAFLLTAAGVLRIAALIVLAGL